MDKSRLRNTRYLSTGLQLFVSYMGVVTAPLAIGAYTEGDHLSGALSGALSSVEVGSLSLVLLSSPVALRRASVRTLGWAGLLAAISGEALSGHIGKFWPLLGLRALVGAGCGSMLCATTCAVAVSESADRVMAVGLAIAYSLFILMFPLLAEIVKTWGPQALFLALAAALSASAISVTALPRKAAFHSPSDNHSVRGQVQPVRARRLTAGLYLLSVVILSLSLAGVWVFAERIANHLHLHADQIGLIFSLCSFSMIAGCLAAGIVGDHFGQILPAMAGVALAGIGAYGATIASGAPTFSLALVVYNIAYLFLAPYVVVGIPSQLDDTNRLPVVATGALWLSYSAGITASGLLVERAGFHLLGIVSLTGCMIATGLLGIVAMFQRAHEPRQWIDRVF